MRFEVRIKAVGEDLPTVDKTFEVEEEDMEDALSSLDVEEHITGEEGWDGTSIAQRAKRVLVNVTRIEE